MNDIHFFFLIFLLNLLLFQFSLIGNNPILSGRISWIAFSLFQMLYLFFIITLHGCRRQILINISQFSWGYSLCISLYFRLRSCYFFWWIHYFIIGKKIPNFSFCFNFAISIIFRSSCILIIQYFYILQLLFLNNFLINWPHVFRSAAIWIR